MKRYFKLFIAVFLCTLLVTGCGKSDDTSNEYDDILNELEKKEEKLTVTENYYNPKEYKLIKEKVNGYLSSVYYDFDKDGEEEFLIARVKDSGLVLSLYEYKEEVLKEYDNIVLFEDFLGFPDTIKMNCFIKLIDGELYIFAESVGYSNLIGDGINWNYKKIGFSNGKFWEVAKDSLVGSYFDDDSIKAKKAFVKDTSLTVDKFEFEENGKMLYEQNKDKALDFFTITREHLDDFDQSKYDDGKETNVKYGKTTYTTSVINTHNLNGYI